MFLFCFFVFDLIVLSWTQVSFVHIGNEYVINNKTLSYSSAKNVCESINSTLVVINDGNRNILVDKIRENFTEPVTRFWIKTVNLTEDMQIQIISPKDKYKFAIISLCPGLEVSSGSKNNNETIISMPCNISYNEIEILPRFICQKPAPLKITSTTTNEEISPTTTRSTATSDIIDSKTTSTQPTLLSNPGYSAIAIAYWTAFVLIFLLVLSLIYVYLKLIKFKRKMKTENFQLQEKKTGKN